MLVGFDDYYPCGGLDDVVAVFSAESDDEAREIARGKRDDASYKANNYELLRVAEDRTARIHYWRCGWSAVPHMRVETEDSIEEPLTPSSTPEAAK